MMKGFPNLCDMYTNSIYMILSSQLSDNFKVVREGNIEKLCIGDNNKFVLIPLFDSPTFKERHKKLIIENACNFYNMSIEKKNIVLQRCLDFNVKRGSIIDENRRKRKNEFVNENFTKKPKNVKNNMNNIYRTNNKRYDYNNSDTENISSSDIITNFVENNRSCINNKLKCDKKNNSKKNKNNLEKSSLTSDKKITDNKITENKKENSEKKITKKNKVDSEKKLTEKTNQLTEKNKVDSEKKVTLTSDNKVTDNKLDLEKKLTSLTSENKLLYSEKKKLSGDEIVDMICDDNNISYDQNDNDQNDNHFVTLQKHDNTFSSYNLDEIFGMSDDEEELSQVSFND